MKIHLLTTALSAALMLAPLATSEIYQDAIGKVELNQTPENIVIFDLAPLDTLDALGVPISGVIKPYALNYLAKYQNDSYENVGTFFEPDYETTASLEPDLIIIGPRASKQRHTFEQIAPTFDSSVWGDNFLDQFYQMTETLAAVVDKEAEAEQRLNAIKNKVSELQVLTANQGEGLFLIVSGGKILAFGPGSRFGWLYTDLGVPAAIGATEGDQHGEPISFEFLKQINPDWLFVLDRDAAVGQAQGGAKALLDNPIVNSINAAQKDQILYLDGYAWYLVSYGLTAVDSAISQIHTAYSR